MASKGVHFDSTLDASSDVPKRPSDANSNDLLDLDTGRTMGQNQTTVGRESVESGYGGDDDLASSRGTASSLTGSVSSLLEEPSAATPTDDQRQAWLDEIAKIDEEAATLRLVLQAKIRRSTDLKRKLGITQLDEFKVDAYLTLKDIRESTAYTKTSAALQVVSQKTSAAVTSAVDAFRGAANESAANPGQPKVGNTIFKDASEKLSSAASATGTYVSATVESVKASPTMQAVGASVNSTWMKLKASVVGGVEGSGATAQNNDSFIGDVVNSESSA